MSVKASCLCGYVVLELDEPFSDVTHCHCRSCRKFHGAAFATYVTLPNPQCRVVAGPQMISSFQSSPGVQRAFCRHCGSPLWYQSERFAGTRDIPAAILDEPLSLAPSAHVHSREQVSWLRGAEDLPHYSEEVPDAP